MTQLTLPGLPSPEARPSGVLPCAAALVSGLECSHELVGACKAEAGFYPGVMYGCLHSGKHDVSKEPHVYGTSQGIMVTGCSGLMSLEKETARQELRKAGVCYCGKCATTAAKAATKEAKA